MFNVIIGRLGKDAEVIETSNGSKCVKFTVAENKYRNGEDKTIWYDVTSYDPFVVNTQIKVLKKGAFVVIVGDVDCRINIGKNGKVYLNYNVITSTINVPNLGNGERKNTDTVIEQTVTTGTMPTPKKKETQPEPAYSQVSSQPTTNMPTEVLEDDGDDLPF